MTENNIKLVNEGGKIVGKDPETGETVPIELGETITETLSAESLESDDANLRDIRSPALGHTTLSRMRQETRDSDPALIGVVDGILYGRLNVSEIYRSEDGGESWSFVTDTPSSSSLRYTSALGDGEVLASGGEDALYKSSGWDGESSASFSNVLDAPGDSSFLYRCVDIEGDSVLATTYGHAGSGSRYVWLSTDNAESFTQVLDIDDRNGNGADNGHLHFAEIDPHADDRLWTSWHEPSDLGDASETLYSDDGGGTWDRLVEEHPTTGTALSSGMVFGSDQVPEGVYRALRTEDPADMEYELLHRWLTGTISLSGFAQQAFHDKARDVAYIAFRVQNGPATGAIAAATARSASMVWQQETIQSQSGTGATFVAVDGDDTVVADVQDGDTSKRVFADGSKQGDYDPQALDRGNVFGGWADPTEGQVAVGRGARIIEDGAEGRATAVGFRATARHQQGTAVGYDTETQFRSVAVGDISQAENWSTALGRRSRATSNRAVAVGESAEALGSRSIAIGHETTVDSSDQGRVGVGALAFGAVEGTFADADLNNSEVTFEIDQTNNNLVVKVKDSEGNVLTGSVDLS